MISGPPAVVLGLSPTGLYAVRELGRAGVPVLGVSATPQAGGWSKYLNYGPRLIVQSDENARLGRLMDAVSAEGLKPVLIPTSDQDVDFVIRYREILSERFVFQKSYSDGVAQSLMDKAALYERCRTLGIPIPASWAVSRQDVVSLADDICFPCLVKPSLIHEVKTAMAGRKLWTARTRDEFYAVCAGLPIGETCWLVQEIVPGPESQITVYAAHVDLEGHSRHACTCIKLRQYPPGFGSASLVRTKVDEETQRLSEQLLRAAGYRGIAATEFKRDQRDGRLVMIEMNPRPSLWFSATTGAGKTITLSAWAELAGEPSISENPQLDGVEWRFQPKDFSSRVFYFINRDFVLPPPDHTGLPPPTRRISAVLTRDDPMPVFGELANFGRKIIARVFPPSKVGA